MSKKPLNESRGTYVPSPPRLPPPLPTAIINNQKIVDVLNSFVKYMLAKK